MTTQAVIIHLKQGINTKKATVKIIRKLKKLKKDLKKSKVEIVFEDYDYNSEKISIRIKYDADALYKKKGSDLFSGYLEKELKPDLEKFIEKIE